MANININQPKLLLFTDHFNATYYLALHYSLISLQQQNKLNFMAFSQQDVQKKANNNISNGHEVVKNILQVANPSVVIFNRYGLPYGELILDECRKQKIKTIYFIDDDLLHIPDNLHQGIQHQHGTPEIISSRKYLLENVDLIWISTEYLKQKIQQIFPNQYCVWGNYPPYLDFLVNKPKNKAKSTDFWTFGYMGSKGHNRDLELISDAISQILIKYPHTRFETFGTVAIPEKLASFGSRVTSHKVITNYQDFLGFLYQLNWHLGLAPLEYNVFNLCKSPVKYLEYTACEMPTIASNSPVYNMIINSDNGVLAEPEQWYEKINLFVDNPDIKQNFVHQAQRTCQEKFTLQLTETQILNMVQL
jgi:glycosyltransferase involved in cell wall biosynthesis